MWSNEKEDWNIYIFGWKRVGQDISRKETTNLLED